ncbi:LPD5 domain-containing protein [Luteolibacter flavescens]|uniref:LPD5 domain-containing protein n=1 Tax=Luteolibacter flavescens TaxID=1859460 RepID=A0ABT3FQD0_9BACT|nr:LPD5 domain-containing protein [Luteolibacter flavescens]MCW1885524.1 LPD5 domain-containing protein [Luteolibacter flavescens]
MANNTRLSPAEEEVQSYLQKASVGQAGVNPRAQTLARSSGDPVAQRIGQDLVERQHRQNQKTSILAQRDAEAQAKAQAAESAKQQRDLEKTQREERARNVRMGAAAGMVTTTDIETGERSIKRHDDGSPVYKPGAVGAPVQLAETTLTPTSNPLVPDAGASGVLPTKAETKPVWQQTFRDDRGTEVTEPLPEKTDEKTAERYVEVPDAFGRPQRRVVGTDPKAAELLKIQKEQQNLDGREHAFRQANAAFKPKWDRIAADYKAAKGRKDALAGKYVREPESTAHRKSGGAARMGRYDTYGNWQPLADHEKGDEFIAFQKERYESEQEFRRAQAEYTKHVETSGNHERVEREIKEQRVRLKERERRIELGLPADDGGIARELAEMETGLLGGPAMAAAAVANEEIVTPRPVPPGSENELRQALGSIAGDNLTLEGKRAGQTYIYRGREAVGKIDASSGVPTLVLQTTSPADVLAAVSTSGQPGGLQTYVADNLRERKSPQEEAQWMAQVMQVISQPTQGPLAEGQSSLPQPDPNDVLKAMGASHADILRKTKDGSLSIGHAETLMNRLYDDTLKASDPKSPETFNSWLGGQEPRMKYEWQKANAKKDHDTLQRIQGQFVSEWYSNNRHKPGVTFAMQKAARGVGLPEKTGGDIAKGLMKDTGGIVVDAAGSMLGMFSGLAGQAVFTVGGVVSDDMAEGAKAQRAVIGRAGANFNRGLVQNYTKHLTDEGKARNNALGAAEAKLRLLIENRHEVPDADFREQIFAASQAVGDRAFDLHGLNLEDGWAVERSDFDVLGDQSLGSALIGFAETGDPELWESFRRRLRMDKGHRQAEETMAALTEGQGRFASAFSAGVMAPPQEMGIELLSTALTAGTGKLLSTGARATLEGAEAAAASTRLSRLRGAVAGLRDDFAGTLKFSDTLANPASKAKRFANKAVDVAKVQTVEGIGEGIEEGVAALADPNVTEESFKEQVAAGFVGAIFLGPLTGAIGGAHGTYRQRYEKAKATKQFTDWYNRTNADTPGFAPMTPQEAESALSMVDPVTHKQLADEHAVAVQDLVAAAEELANAKPVPARGVPSDNGTAAEVGAAWRENAASKFSRATVRAEDTSAALTNYVGGVVEAAQSTKAMDAPTKARTLGLVKVATGRTDLLTGAERRAITGLQTRDGMPYFADVNGQTVFTAEGRAELLADQPLVGGLVQTDESRALVDSSPLTQPEPTSPTNEQNTQGPTGPQPAQEAPQAQPPAGQTAAGGPGPVAGAPQPQGQAVDPETARRQAEDKLLADRGVLPPNPNFSPAERAEYLRQNGVETAASAPPAQPNYAGMDTAEYETLRAADPSLPDVPAVVGQARAAGRTVSPSMARAAGESTSESPGAAPESLPDHAISAAELPQQSPSSPESPVAEPVRAAVARAEAKFPALKGRFTVDATGERIGSGGAYMLEGRVVINLADTREDLAAFDGTEQQEARLDAVLGEEIVHLAQLEAAQRAGESFKESYALLWDEFTAMQQRAAAATYGQESFARLETWQQAAETVRMLVQQRVDGRVTELTRAFTKDMPQQLIQLLRSALNFLRDLVAKGDVPPRVRQAIDAIEGILTEYQGKHTDGAADQSNGAVQAESNGAPAPAQDENAPMRVIGLAIRDAAAADKRLTKNLRRDLELATEDLDAVLETLPPDQRRPYFDQAIRGWLDERFPPKRQPDQPAGVRAREILNSGEFPTLSAVFANGKIAPRPNVISLVLARKRAGEKLTEREMAVLRNTAEHDDAVFQNQFENAGNGRVAREILSLLMAKSGEGVAPDVMASMVEEGSTASDLWAMIGTELNQVATGQRAAGTSLDPNREWTDAEIAAAEAARAAMPEPEERAAFTVEEDDDILFSSTSIGQGMFDFGASGELGTRQQLGFSFEASPSTPKPTTPDIIPAAQLQGPKIDETWTAYGPRSGTLGIPRAEMPQIRAEDRSALVQFLRARGVAYATEDVLPGTLRPTQAEYSPAKVRKAREYEGGNRSILVSSDGHVVDGHHQWMASLSKAPAEPMAVIRLMAPIRQLLPLVLEMPSAATRSAGATPSAVSPSLKAGELGDFGVKMQGARKDQPRTSLPEIRDDEISGKSLSEIWPKSALDAITDEKAAAVAHAARDLIPAKPRNDWKLRRWVETVKQARQLFSRAQDLGPEELITAIRNDRSSIGLHKFADTVDLLGMLPREQWGRVSNVADYPDAYSYDRGTGEKVPAPFTTASFDGQTVRAPNLEALADQIRDKLGQKPAAKKMEFQVRGPRSGIGEFYINKKGDPLYRKLKTFSTSEEAFAFIRKNAAELAEAWNQVKESDNVKEDDLRTRANRPRTGTSRRSGKDASPEMFQTAFGFRGVEFGNWVSQGANAKERQGMLNEAFDALHDLAVIIGIPSRGVSLEGQLGLAFGSRGSGKASAHYEPGNLVINLTKTRGAGTLAHEWFHALDHYFQRKRPISRNDPHGGSFITFQPEGMMRHKLTGEVQTKENLNRLQNVRRDGKFLYNVAEDWEAVPGVRPEVEKGFLNLVSTLNASPMAKRAAKIDKGKSDGYWSRIIEIAARSFENYVISRMMRDGFHNDYLANVTPVSEFVRDPGRYPYHLDEEMAPIEGAFDDLFATIRSEEAAGGEIRLFSSPANQAPAKIVEVTLPEGFPDERASSRDIAEWARTNLRGNFPSPVLGQDVGVTRYGLGHTAQQNRKPERMRVIAALPELIEQARIVSVGRDGMVTMHSVAELGGKPLLVRITVEPREGDSTGPWSRFYDLKTFEIEDAPAAYSAFPSGGDGSILANPERTVTLAQLAEIVKKVEGDGVTLLSAPSKDTQAAVDAALAAMPPLQREVFRRISNGATEAEVMKRFGLSELGVSRVLNDVRARLAVATQAASTDGLQPVMRDGKIDGGRPDLGYGAQPAMAAIDQARNDSDVPGVRGRAEVIAKAEEMLSADYQGTYDSILSAGADERQLADYEVAAAKIILGREMIDGGAKTKAQQVKLAMLAYSYRDIGTETARALAMRFDPHMRPAERHAQFLAEVLTTPDAATRKAMKGKTKAQKESMLAQWMDRVKAIKEELLAQGIDIDASLAAFRRLQQAQKQTQAESPRAMTVIDEQVKKLTKREKLVVQAIRSGATWDAVSFQTGMDVKDAKKIYRDFYAGINDAMAASAKRYLESALAASGMSNAMRSILDDLGVPHPDDIAADAADQQKRQKEKAVATRRESERKNREKKREQVLGKPVGKPDITLDEWAGRPPATWRTLYETEMKALRPRDRFSFTEWAAKEFPETHREWQAEMNLLPKAERMRIDEWAALPATREKFRKQSELFAEPINETTGPSERKTTIGQGELGLDPELKVDGAYDPANPNPIERELEPWNHGPEIPGGTFDLNDPVAMKEVMNAFAIARGSKLDALMEYWRSSILTGPQTHIVNVGSNFLHVAYDLLPRRGTEALINNLLGLVGQGSDRAATFKEFVPMARQLHKATQLAARNAVRSWKLESRTFDAYARAEALQLDFTGLGAEYIPPALGGKIGKIMRALSFRAMTAADEFFKSLYAQFEVAGQSHRIARIEEKLTGKAYEDRMADLMEPGSKAWLRAIDGAKRVTFQEELDGEGPRLINRLDQVAQLLKQGRSAPYIGRPLTLVLPFIDTPLNIFKQAIQMSPLGSFLIVVDGIRSLRRRVMAAAKDRGLLKSPKHSPEQLRADAEQIYDRLRLIQDLTNQTLGWAALFAMQGLVGGGEEDELPIITGTVPYKTTRRGERDNAYAVMPPMTIRIPGTGVQFSYSRVEPFATMLASSADLLVTINRQGGLKPAVASETVARFKDQVSEKTFLQGLSSLLNAIEDPDRFGERMTSNIVTGFVPNLIRQPLRESDTVVRDQNPRADDGFLYSVAKRVGYSLAPGKAPAKTDVWGREVPSARGEQFGGTAATDLIFRILDPTNATFGTEADPIDRWIFRYNLATADSKERVAIEPISNAITVRFPGNDKSESVGLSAEDQAEANRNAGQLARRMLGDDWETRPLTEEHAERIKDVVSQAQKSERARLRAKVLAERSATLK